MKKNLFLLSLLALLNLGFVSCSDDEDDDSGGSASNLFGKWRAERVFTEGEWFNLDDLNLEVLYELNKDFTYTSYQFELDQEKTLVIEDGDSEIENGKFTVKGKKMYTYPAGDDDEEEFTYSINGDRLTFSYYDEEDDYEFKLNLKRYTDDEFNLALEKIKICGVWVNYGEENDEYVYFSTDGSCLFVTAVHGWSWGDLPMPVRKFGNWQFSDGKLVVEIGEDTTIMTYEIDEYMMELTLNGKQYDRDSTSTIYPFWWVDDK